MEIDMTKPGWIKKLWEDWEKKHPPVNHGWYGCGPMSPKNAHNIKMGKILCPYCGKDHNDPLGLGLGF